MAHINPKHRLISVRAVEQENRGCSKYRSPSTNRINTFCILKPRNFGEMLPCLRDQGMEWCKTLYSWDAAVLDLGRLAGLAS